MTREDNKFYTTNSRDCKLTCMPNCSGLTNKLLHRSGEVLDNLGSIKGWQGGLMTMKP